MYSIKNTQFNRLQGMSLSHTRVLFLAVLHLLSQLASAQVSSVQFNTCEEMGDEGNMVYYACSSQPALLLSDSAAPFSITVSPEDYTCGVTRIEFYCTLGSISTCDSCNANSESKRHPPEFAVDRSTDRSHLDTWWQSITWSGPLVNGQPSLYPQPLEVVMTISFNKSYELQSDIKITFESSRPRSMVLEKSLDFGQTWSTWQIYRRRCTGLPTFVPMDEPDTVTCTQKYSRELPYREGVVVFDVIADRLGPFLGESFSNYERLYTAYDETNLHEFLTFTDIRLKLLEPMTDGGEVGGNFLDLMKYYYAISNIQVTASCSCHLHARFCRTDESDTVYCLCEHNTEGVSCERCKPLYNNKPWQSGFYLPYPTGTANPCEKCECNDHADSCTYNSTLDMGVCDNCYDNTMGVHCQKCVPSFYKNSSVEDNHPDTCIACGCELLGVVNNNTECHQETGNCDCLDLVTGRQCNVCVNKYYGLLLEESPGTCKECNCDVDGTNGQREVCDKENGQCPCKVTTTGRVCDTCKDGYWDFPRLQPFRECKPCNCNQGGSTSLVCDKVSGQCPCRENVTGLLCDDTEAGFFTPSLDHFQFQPKGGSCRLSTGLISEENPFTGIVFSLCKEEQYVTFDDIAGDTSQPEVEWSYLPVLRYTLENTTEVWANLSLQFAVTGQSFVDVGPFGDDVSSSCPVGNGQTQEFQLTNLEPGVGMAYIAPSNLTIDVRCKYSITLTASAKGTATSEDIFIDSIVLFPDPAAVAQAMKVSEESMQACIEGIGALTSRDVTVADPNCTDITFIVMSQLFSGSEGCNCDPVGSVSAECSPVGGACQCKAGVYGRQCDHCAPGYYNFTQSGCTACNCDNSGASNPVCDTDSGQCTCRPNVASQGQQNALDLEGGLRCSACLKDYFGLSSGEGCQRCDCDEQGSNSSQCSESGQCECKLTITGTKCDTCQPGYFSKTEDGCVPCRCSEAGSVGVECHQAGGQCTCKLNVEGDKCDTCKDSSFNLNPLNPHGCQPCFCYGHSSQCSSASGFTAYHLVSEDISTNWTAVDAENEGDLRYRRAPSMYTGNKQYSYSRLFTVEIRSRSDAEFSLDNYKPVILEGNGKRVYYNASGFLVTGDYKTLEVVLHEKYFYYNESARPDYFNFYAILADLEALFIMRKYGVEVVDLNDITMETAVAISSQADVEVTFVESCTCEASRNVAGLSCESCSQGHRRSGSGVGLYDTCVACDCNSRGETDPPVCDPLTGQCLNCRNGTMGNNCEECAPHVDAASDCTQCEDTYWGLSEDGCQECGCDPVSSVSAVCNKDTGICECKANVVGDKCDECADNFYDRTQTGCIECDTCYGLVMAEVNDLREMRDNLTSLLETLQFNDNNTRLGPFADRLQRTTEDMGQLTLFLVEANNVEQPVSLAITELNSTLISLESLVDINATTGLTESEVTLSNTSLRLQQVDTVRQQISESINSTQAILEDNEDLTSTQFTSAVESLQSTNRTIFEATNSTVDTVTSLTAMAEEIQNKSSQAKTIADETLQLVTDITAAHNADATQTTDFELTEFSALTRTVNTAEDALQKNQDDTRAIIEDNARLLDSVNNIQSIDTDISALIGQSQSIAEQATVLTEMASNFTEEELDIMNVRIVQSQENLALLSQQVSSLGNQSMEINSELSVLHTNATAASNQTQQNFLEATMTLDIVSNFGDKAAAVEAQANASLGTVQEVTSTSQDAINSARSKRTSLQSALSNSQVGLTGVRIAEARAAANLQQLLPLQDRANAITSRAESNLTDIETNSNSVTLTSQNKVVPAQEACSDLETQVTSLESQSTLALNKASNLSTVINNTQDRLHELLQEIQDVGSINTDKITELRNLITQAKADFDRRQLSTSVENLRGQVASQKEWLNNMRARKLEMQAQIQRLRTVRAQLSP